MKTGQVALCSSSQVAQQAKVGPNPIAIGLASTGAGKQLLDSNPDRVELLIQNSGTAVIFIGLGFMPDAGNYSLALSACAASNDGTGGFYSSLVWKGPVFAAAAAANGQIQLSEEI